VNTKNMVAIGLCAVVFAGTGCATTTPYIANELGAQIAATPSAFHEFTYVRAYEDDGELVLYGKLRHTHDFCEQEGHVDVAIDDVNNPSAFTASLPLRQQSRKRQGWYGAGFRTRVALNAPARFIRLVFHDPGCHTGPSFDCGSNQAAGAISTTPSRSLPATAPRPRPRR
jgi:hypothetical protein